MPSLGQGQTRGTKRAREDEAETSKAKRAKTKAPAASETKSGSSSSSSSSASTGLSGAVARLGLASGDGKEAKEAKGPPPRALFEKKDKTQKKHPKADGMHPRELLLRSLMPVKVCFS